MALLMWVILITAAAGLGGTGIGGIAGAFLHGDSKKRISLLLGFAGGVMISVVCLDLIREALEGAGLTLVISGILLGYMSVFLINDLAGRISDLSRKGFSSRNFSRQMLLSGFVMAIAIALHNLPEGVVIGVGYADGSTETMFKIQELALAIVIGLHDIPEGMAVAVPLIAGGMSKPRAVFITALTGLPTVLGALIGFMLGRISPVWTSLSLSFASGAMLYVVLGELLPETFLMWRSKFPALAVLAGIITGIVIIFI